MYHVLGAKQFGRRDLEDLFDSAQWLESRVRSGGLDVLRGRIMATVFFEPSTRTRLSFEAAMLRLGGSVISTENAAQFSSAIKGETLEDSIRVIGAYADVIVLRHYEEGAAARAAAVSAVPVINAGDGPGEHPTQALLDLYTIYREKGKIDGLRIAMVGDLAYGRTVHSLAYLLSLFEGIHIDFVAPPETPIPRAILDYLRQRGVSYSEEQDLEQVAARADVLYQTRIQKERFASQALYERVYGRYVVDPPLLARMKKDAVIMHPLPRAGEIDPAVDSDPRAAYFRQAAGGLYIRMALLCRCLEAFPKQEGFRPGRMALG
ncbi:MAG: aspartate carbamoyltransferase [Alicyclobacillaceae bacterium]|nr:aspartate carbamoyltransferase [Alicyclobacillaceae bacterium]